MNGAEDPPKGENLIDLIDRLVEPAAPPPVPLTPQTSGWWVLAALLLLLLVYLAWRGRRRWQANAYRREALAELHAAGADPAAIAAILRRTALAAWPREQVASLSGPDWLRFLDRTGASSGFEEGPGRSILRAPYADASDKDADLADLAASWIRHHRADKAQ